MSQKRKMGFMERALRYGHDHGNGAGILTSMIRVKGPLTPEITGQALGMLQRRHQALRARFHDSEEMRDCLAVDEEPGDPPLEVKEARSDGEWLGLMEQNMVRMFNKDGRLWRTTLLLGGDGDDSIHHLVVKFHHSICDGVSAGSFFGEFVKYCRFLLTNKPPDVKELPLLPAMEEMLVRKASWYRFSSAMLRYAFVPQFKMRRDLYPFEEHVPFGQRRTRNIYHIVDEVQLTELLDMCRQEATTLTGLLTAALMMGTYAVTRNQTGRYEHMPMTPVSVRDLCEPVVDRNRIGCFIMFAPTSHSIDENTSIWELARSYNRKLDDNLQHLSTPFDFPRLILLAGAAGPEYGFLKMKYPYGIGVTNIGRVDYPANIGPFKIERFFFSSARHLGDCPVLLNCGTIENRLFLSFSYEEPLISEGAADSIVDASLSILDSISSPSVSVVNLGADHSPLHAQAS